jgi:chemotaxis protein histidine kinase CheA
MEEEQERKETEQNQEEQERSEEDMATRVSEPKVTEEFDVSVYKGLYMRESRSSLAALRQKLDRLQDEPSDQAALRQAHRAAHTLKGMSATMHYETLTNLGYALEKPLAAADRDELTLLPGQMDILLAVCDEFEKELDRLEAADNLPSGVTF